MQIEGDPQSLLYEENSRSRRRGKFGVKRGRRQMLKREPSHF